MEEENLGGFLNHLDAIVNLSESEKILSISECLIAEIGRWDSLLILTNSRLLIRPRNISEMYPYGVEIITPNHTQDIELKNILKISVKGFKRLMSAEGEFLLGKAHIILNSGEFDINVLRIAILYEIAESANLKIVERSNFLRTFNRIIINLRQIAFQFIHIVQLLLALGVLFSAYILILSILQLDFIRSLIMLFIFIICLLSTLEYIGIKPVGYEEAWNRIF